MNRNPRTHVCVSDDELRALFIQIGEQPRTDPEDFFGLKRLEKIAGCTSCSRRVRAVYALVVECPTAEAMIGRLRWIELIGSAAGGENPAQRLVALLFV